MTWKRINRDEPCNVIYRVEFRDESQVDFNYTTSEKLARAFIKRHSNEPTMGQRRLDRPWKWWLWIEPLDEYEGCGEIVAEFDWWGDQVDPVCQEVGWSYGPDLKPKHNEPEEDNCPVCAKDLAKRIEEVMEKYQMKDPYFESEE